MVSLNSIVGGILKEQIFPKVYISQSFWARTWLAVKKKIIVIITLFIIVVFAKILNRCEETKQFEIKYMPF
jgi:hypothetical protein